MSERRWAPIVDAKGMFLEVGDVVMAAHPESHLGNARSPLAVVTRCGGYSWKISIKRPGTKWAETANPVHWQKAMPETIAHFKQKGML